MSAWIAGVADLGEAVKTYATTTEEVVRKQLEALNAYKSDAGGVAGYLERESLDKNDVDISHRLQQFKVADKEARQYYNEGSFPLPVAVDEIYSEYKIVVMKSRLRRGLLKKMQAFTIESEKRD